jgi:5-formyltetrahydrofolate cyclo-ligase
MLKKEARKMYRQRRLEITPSQKLKWDDLLLIQFQTLRLPFLSRIMSFYPIDVYNEVDTFPITDYLHFKNPALEIAYPRTDLKDHTMQAVLCGPDTIFEDNEFNVPEPLLGEVIDPASLDLVLVPLLGFDEEGHRIGYGKGFYDRFLTICREDCMKVGLSYFEPVERLKDTHEFDVPLDICITPHQVYVF